MSGSERSRRRRRISVASRSSNLTAGTWCSPTGTCRKWRHGPSPRVSAVSCDHVDLHRVDADLDARDVVVAVVLAVSRKPRRPLQRPEPGHGGGKLVDRLHAPGKGRTLKQPLRMGHGRSGDIGDIAQTCRFGYDTL